MPTRKLIIGLGNPGADYQSTRHNAGFAFVQNFAALHHFPAFKLEQKFQALLSRDPWHNQDLILALPQTFMNLSGESAAALVKFYQLELARDLLLVYDDLDLTLGTYKFTTSSPHGHNGVLSLQQHLGQLTCPQIRLGIDDRQGSRQIPPADYVLQKFSPAQQEILFSQVFPRAGEDLQLWLSKE